MCDVTIPIVREHVAIYSGSYSFEPRRRPSNAFESELEQGEG